jgi:hypothetical protein
MEHEFNAVEAARLGLPSRSPLSPFESIVWSEFPNIDLSDSDDDAADDIAA